MRLTIVCFCFVLVFNYYLIEYYFDDYFCKKVHGRNLQSLFSFVRKFEKKGKENRCCNNGELFKIERIGVEQMSTATTGLLFVFFCLLKIRALKGTVRYYK